MTMTVALTANHRPDSVLITLLDVAEGRAGGAGSEFCESATVMTGTRSAAAAGGGRRTLRTAAWGTTSPVARLS